MRSWSVPTNGALSGFNTNTGAITYSPVANYYGPDAFQFTVSDGSLLATGTVFVTVTPVNDAPIANNQNVTTFEDVSTNLVLVGSDIESAVTYAILSGPTQGTLGTLNINTGGVTYTPATNYNGADSFTFTVSDGSLLATGTVSITVLPLNDSPVANNQSVTIPEDTSTNLILVGSDLESPVTFAVLSGPTHGSLGTLNVNSGAVSYTPNTNYNGADSFTFTVSDGSLLATGTVSIAITPVNDAPIANNQNVTTPEDTSTNLVLTGSDVDNTVTYAILSGPTHGALGTLDINTGAVTYTPNTNYNGADGFTFTVSDGSLLATGTVSITVTPVNDTPFVVEDNYSIFKNATLTVPVSGVLTNDSDVDGNPLTALLAAGPTHAASFTLNSNGSFTYTPLFNYVGVDTFTYRATDGSATSIVATATINIQATNTAPIAIGQNVAVPEDTATNLVLDSFDVDGNSLTFIIVTGPTNGVLSLVDTNNGTVTYTPNTNFNGGDSFTFQVNDGFTNSGIATVGIIVTPVNDAPVANNQNVNTPEDTFTNLVLVGSDIDSLVTYAILVGPTNGLLSGFNTNTGAITYAPALNYNGQDAFRFTVSDGSLLATGTVFITVTPVNDAPDANNQNVTIPEDTSTNLVLTGSDLEGPITYAILSAPIHGGLGVLNTNSGAVTYSPNTNYYGTDSFTFTVNDGSLLATGTVFITINPVNDAPIANNQNVTTPEDTATNLVLVGSDIDSVVTYAVLSGPTHGALGTLDMNTGAVTYTPSTNYNGADSFTFTVSDGSLSATGTVSITVTPANDAPVANNQNVTTPEDTSTNLVLIGSDVDSAVTYAILVGPTNGALSGFNTNTGAITYAPSTNYYGPDAFQFTVSDGALFATGTVFITVTPVDDAPIANNQNVTTPEDTSTNLVLVGSDIDGPITYAILSAPTQGTLGILNTNSGAVTYTPNTNYNGADSFTFTVSDGSLLATGTVFITVTPVNDTPFVVDDNYSIFKNATLTIPVSGVLTNDSDVDGNSLTALLVAGPLNAASFTLNPNGSFTYTPASNYVGLDTFTYRATDGLATSIVATATISIQASNTAPVAFGQNVTTPEDTATNLVLSASDSDGNALTFIIVNAPTNGVLSLVNSNAGTLTYTPNANFYGGDSFTFRVNDGFTNSGVATIGITVTPVNDAPVANNQNVTTPEDTATNLVLVGSDVEGPVTYAILLNPTNGSLSGFDTNTGAITYAPASNYYGPDSIQFTVSDGALLATGTVFITVTPVNDAPLAKDQIVTIPEDTSTNLVLVGSDVDGSVTYAILSGPTQGTLGTLNTNTGAVAYTPTANYNGADSFTFTVSDGSLLATGTVSIAITPVNDAPIANNQSVTTPEDTSTNLVLVGSDVEGPVTYTILSGPTQGALGTLNSTNGAVTYTPNTNYFGPDSFTFTVSDGSLLATGTVSITVVAVNDPPVANNLSVFTPYNTATNIVVSGSDVENAVTYAVLDSPTHGTLGALDANTGAVTYTPNNGYFGPDVFHFTVNDGSLLATGTVTITVISPTQADVSVAKSGTLSAIAGATLTYNIAVTNLGGATSTNVLVNDQLPAGLTFLGAVPTNATVLNNLVSWPAFNLPSGASSNFTVTATAAQGGIYTNIASSGASTSDPNPGNNDGTSTNSQVVTIVSATADVAISKTGPANGLAGANLTYTIVAANNGPSTSSNVVVLDQLPAGFIFVSALPSTVAISNNLVSWPAFTLASGASSNFTITARASDGGIYTNVASSIASTPDPDLSNNNGSSPSAITITAITPQADVAILKIGSASVLAGSTVTYGITATNAGPSTASNVVVRDIMPAGMTFQSASGSYTLSSNTSSGRASTCPVVPLQPLQ
jgi:uncharacterized repeat protein (TIGR01451 family)